MVKYSELIATRVEPGEEFFLLFLSRRRQCCQHESGWHGACQLVPADIKFGQLRRRRGKRWRERPCQLIPAEPELLEPRECLEVRHGSDKTPFEVVVSEIQADDMRRRDARQGGFHRRPRYLPRFRCHRNPKPFGNGHGRDTPPVVAYPIVAAECLIQCEERRSLLWAFLAATTPSPFLLPPSLAGATFPTASRRLIAAGLLLTRWREAGTEPNREKVPDVPRTVPDHPPARFIFKRERGGTRCDKKKM